MNKRKLKYVQFEDEILKKRLRQKTSELKTFKPLNISILLLYLPVNADCALKSPVEFQRLPNPTLPLFVVLTDCGRGDGDGAGDMELLLGESDCMDPFD